MPDWPKIIDMLGREGVDVSGGIPRAVAGGDIDAAFRLDGRHGPVFLKMCAARDQDRLAGEAAGLRELARAAVLRVPRVLAVATDDVDTVLALEWLSFGRPDRQVEETFGTQLAQLHRVTQEQFGWHRDNHIGRTQQVNTPDDDWLRFFRMRRLEYQLGLAAGNGFDGELQEAGCELAGRLERFFDDYSPVASLLHGDLWGGNWAAVSGEAVVFDPAVYFGDRETDLAMTRLFGGFGDAFYRAYESAWPLAGNHRERQLLYQLYHLLNHLNLFGGGYLGRALQIIRQLNRR